jgi:hypothetical protein
LNTDRLIAFAQVGLSALFLSGYFLVIILFMMGFANIPVDYKEAFAGLLSLMTAGGLTILYFWFSRARTAGIPDPLPVTTTITTQTPPPPAPQTTTVTTSPATGDTNESPPTLRPADPDDDPDVVRRAGT